MPLGRLATTVDGQHILHRLRQYEIHASSQRGAFLTAPGAGIGHLRDHPSHPVGIRSPPVGHGREGIVVRRGKHSTDGTRWRSRDRAVPLAIGIRASPAVGAAHAFLVDDLGAVGVRAAFAGRVRRRASRADDVAESQIVLAVRSNRAISCCALHRDLPCADPLQPGSAYVCHHYAAGCNLHLPIPAASEVGLVGLAGCVHHRQRRHVRRPLLFCPADCRRDAVHLADVALEATGTRQVYRGSRAFDPAADPMDCIVPRLSDDTPVRDGTTVAR